MHIINYRRFIYIYIYIKFTIYKCQDILVAKEDRIMEKEEYEEIEPLGKGGFAEVFKVQRIADHVNLRYILIYIYIYRNILRERE